MTSLPFSSLFDISLRNKGFAPNITNIILFYYNFVINITKWQKSLLHVFAAFRDIFEKCPFLQILCPSLDVFGRCPLFHPLFHFFLGNISHLQNKKFYVHLLILLEGVPFFTYWYFRKVSPFSSPFSFCFKISANLLSPSKNSGYFIFRQKK